jgi:8-oxo-dGTP diphosphatase
MISVRWVDGLPPDELPVTQVYGWCFTPDGALIVLEDGGQYTLPGGKPETGETFAETLRREAREEGQLILGAILPFGYRLVEGDPAVLGGKPYAQVRAVALVERLLPPAMDPATGRWYRRLAVPPEEALRRLAWEDAARQLAGARHCLAELRRGE